MSELARCAEGGFLVGPQRVVPEEPAEHQWPDPSGAGVVIGCNHLVCQRCGQAVVQRAGFDATRELKKRRTERLPAVYESCTAGAGGDAGDAGWQGEVKRGSLEEDSRVRLYLCKCALHGEMMVSPVEEAPDGRPGGPASWRCAGHPRASSASTAERTPPAAAAVAGSASGGGGVGAAPAAFVPAALEGQHGGPETIDRRYNLAEDPAQREALGDAVLAHLTASDPRRRMRALGFFSRNPLAPQAARVAELYNADRARFAGDVDFLHEVLGDRLDPKRRFPDASMARDLLRAALLSGARLPDRALARLACFDEPWLAEHAVDAITARPAAERTAFAGELVYALRHLSLDPSGRRTDDRFAELIRRAAAVSGIDRAELRQHLIDATGGATAELIARALP